MYVFFVDLFYNQILSWALYFFFASFAQVLPWATCGNEWNTGSCVGAYDEITDAQELSQFLHCNAATSTASNYTTNLTSDTIQHISPCLRNVVGLELSNGTNLTVAEVIST